MHEVPIYTDTLPYLTTDQIREVDRLMIEEYHIELVQMMENAGRCLAHLARTRFFDGDPRGKHVVILAGKGGNGGGVLVCARWLHNNGAKVEVFITMSSDRLAPVTRHQLDILYRMGVSVVEAARLDGLGQPDLIVDGLIGYSLKDAPRGAAAVSIRWANTSDAPVLALDTPSGLDASIGRVFDPCIKAAATMTLALPKKGLVALGAESYVGELYLADISVPPALYAKPSLGLSVGPVFAEHNIVRLP